MRSELIDARHPARRAVIYIRQSTPHQVLSNQESLRLQYDLRRRALGLGWREEDVEIIDADLGLSGAAATYREGFKDLIARVTLGQVGVVLSSEVTRLTRNCSDWYPLLDLCGYKDCLIADRDGVYDPGTTNGRLLLGLKGTISEVELHTIRARLTAGLLNKAARGELALILPAGLVREVGGVVVKNPDREVQSRLELIFATFLRVRSANKVLRALNERGLSIPRRGRFGDTVWRSPSPPAVLDRDEPAVGDGDAVGVAAQIGECLGGSAEWLLGVDDPGSGAHLGGESVEVCALGQRSEIAKEPERAGVERPPQAFEEQTAEQLCERLDGEEEVRPPGDPARR